MRVNGLTLVAVLAVLMLGILLIAGIMDNSSTAITASSNGVSAVGVAQCDGCSVQAADNLARSVARSVDTQTTVDAYLAGIGSSPILCLALIGLAGIVLLFIGARRSRG